MAERGDARADRADINAVVNDWALARDSGRWDRLRECFTRDAVMYTTWFVGPAEEFVARSMEAAKRPGARGAHFIGGCSVELAGDRAIAETRMILLLRAALDGVEVDVTCYGRFYDFFRYERDAWRIAKRVPIYEKDRIDPLDPNARLALDHAALARLPEGYRHLAWVQSRGGSTPTQGLPTPGGEALAKLYAEGAEWLVEPGARR